MLSHLHAVAGLQLHQCWKQWEQELKGAVGAGSRQQWEQGSRKQWEQELKGALGVGSSGSGSPGATTEIGGNCEWCNQAHGQPLGAGFAGSPSSSRTAASFSLRPRLAKFFFFLPSCAHGRALQR